MHALISQSRVIIIALCVILLTRSTTFTECLSSFSSQSNLDGRFVAPSIVCHELSDGSETDLFGVIQSRTDESVWYAVCESGLWRIKDDRQAPSSNGTTRVDHLVVTTTIFNSQQIQGLLEYIDPINSQPSSAATMARDEGEEGATSATHLLTLNLAFLTNGPIIHWQVQLFEYVIPSHDSVNMTATLLAVTALGQSRSTPPLQYRDAIYFVTTDDSYSAYLMYEYNYTSQQIREIFRSAQYLAFAISYDQQAERILMTFKNEGIAMIQLPIGANATLPILPQPLLTLQCASLSAFRFDSQLVAVCGADLFAWSLVNDTVVNGEVGTLILSSVDPTSVCQIAPEAPPSFAWNSKEQILYMSCSLGQVSSVAIQWNTSGGPIPASPTNNVIVTPLIASSVCSMVFWISIDRRDSSVWLKCLEGFIQTLGRSLNTLYSSTLVYQQHLFVDQSRGFIFFPLDNDGNNTIVRVSGTESLLASTCRTQQLVYDEMNQAFWFLCMNLGFTAQLARMNVNDSAAEYGQTQYFLSNPVSRAESNGIYLLQTNPSSSNFAPSSHLIIDSSVLFLLQLSIYSPLGQKFLPLPFLLNGIITNNFSIPSGQLNLLQLQNLPFTERVLMIASNQTWGSDEPDLTQLWLMRLTNNTSTAVSSYILEVMYAYTLNLQSPSFVPLVFACDTRREVLFFCKENMLIRFDLNTGVNETFVIPTIEHLTFGGCSGIVVDEKRRQVVMVQEQIPSGNGDGPGHGAAGYMLMFDDVTRTFAIGIQPKLTITPSARSIAIIEELGQIMLIMSRGDQPFQLITITQRWTCFPGTSWTVNGLCEACPVGKSRGFVDFDNATIAIPQCQICPLGSIAPSTGSSECQACATGRFADYNLGQVCSPCGLGSYSNQNGSTSCQPCAAGRYSNVTTASICSQCEIGRYSSSASAGCNFCEPGKNQSSKGQTSCSDCLAGTYTSDIGYGECKECDPGSYNRHNGSSVCFPCDGGSASNLAGLDTVCPRCDPGFYSPDIGHRECQPCKPGTYSDQFGASVCFPCNTGSASNETGLQKQCPLCAAGMESKMPGSTQCTSCPLGLFSSEGSSCEPCAVNTYSPYFGANCASCTSTNQRGLYCEFGLASVDSGWWAYLQYDEKLNMSIYRTTQCPDSYCPGTSLQSNASTVLYCNSPRNNSADNWLCAECVEGHIAWGSSCEPCTHANGGLIVLLLVIAFCIVFFLLRSNSAAGPLTILVFFLQISALELGPVRSYIDWIQFANLGTHSTRSCILPITPIQQKILTLFVPVILFIVLGVVGTTHCTLDRFWTASPDHILPLTFISRIYSFIYIRTRNFTIDRYIGVVQAILIFSYTSITATVVQSLHCVEVAPGINRLFSTPQIDCQTNEYRHHLLPFAYIWLIVYVIGFPLAMLTFLWRHRPIIDYISNGGATGPSDRPIDGLQLDLSLSSVQAFDLRWAHFFRPYRSVVWYWQPIAMLRRLVFALISVLLIESPTSKNVMYSFVGFTSLMLHLQAQPFHSVQLNFLEDVSYSLLICISFLLTSQIPPWSEFVPVLLFLLVVPFALGLVIVVFRASYMKMKSNSDPSTDVPLGINNDRSSPPLSSFHSSLNSPPSVEATPPVLSSHSMRRPLLLDDPTLDRTI